MSMDDLTTRRTFLHRGLTLVGAAATVPAFLETTALAVAPAEGARTKSRPGVPDERVLVVVQLAGGNDGLNTVIPVRDDLYYKNRPRLGIERGKTLRLTDDLGLHPSLTGFKELHDAGLLAIVQGVGYPNPNRSHFKSTDIWSTASPDGRLHTGWLGRYFDAQCKGQDPPDPKRGIALTSEAPLTLLGSKFAPVAFQRPESLTWNGAQPAPGRRRPNQRGMNAGPDTNVQQAAFDRLNAPTEKPAGPISELEYLQRTALDARLSAADIQKAAAGRPAASYPVSPLANSLKTVARMITANMPTRIYYVSQGGYDTHTGQLNRHPQLLTQLGDALKAFVDDLKASGHLDRVVIMTFSEFGRRVEENASTGTDHGTAAPLFVLGSRVQPGLAGSHPSLERLDRGDLAFTTDFRSVYAAILKDWLAADAGKILGAPFPPLPIIQRA